MYEEFERGGKESPFPLYVESSMGYDVTIRTDVSVYFATQVDVLVLLLVHMTIKSTEEAFKLEDEPTS